MTITLPTPSVTIAALRVEHREDGFGLGVRCPRLSWRFNATSVREWKQVAYRLRIDRRGKIESYQYESSEHVLVPWPSLPLASREVVDVRVTSYGSDGTCVESEALRVEAGLFERHDWQGEMISGTVPADLAKAKPPFALRKSFTLADTNTARLYATALGVYKVRINGLAVGDHVLAPGWQNYDYRINYQIYDVESLLRAGENTIEVEVGEGWYAGRLGWSTNTYGNRPGFLCQLEIGVSVLVKTDTSWDVVTCAISASGLYDGETYDSRAVQTTICSAISLPFPTAVLTLADEPPVRRVQEIKAVDLIVSPSGRQILDFGENIVGWVRLEKDFEGTELVMRHAEVLEHGEMGMRPLKSAKCTDTVLLGGATKGWEPSFTFHGFRYV